MFTLVRLLNGLFPRSILVPGDRVGKVDHQSAVYAIFASTVGAEGQNHRRVRYPEGVGELAELVR